jgi:lysyl-tRNA synthetase, class II
MDQDKLTSTDEIALRQARLEELRTLGVDPFGQKFDRTHKVEDLHALYEEAESAGGSALDDLPTLKIAGRMMRSRGMGKASFANLSDLTGGIQFYIRKDSIPENEFTIFRKLYVGDHLGLEGRLFKTGKGEVTLRVERLTLLSCGLRPLPEKHHGLKDIETRQRKRYLDLMVNEEVRKTFIIRSKLISSLRKTLDEKGFLEVETPVLNTLAGGANARPFITYHNALKMDFYMRIATELHLKRLLVGGMEKVYEIGRIFRNEGVSHKHNPEFTTLELYEAFSDYEAMMEITETLISEACIATRESLKFPYQGKELDFSPPFKRLSYLQAICEYANIKPESLDSPENLAKICQQNEIDVNPNLPVAVLYDALFSHFVEPKLFQPTFIYDYPIEISPLARKIPDRPHLTYRFEAFVAGMEIANAFSELNDPQDQLSRFKAQEENREQGDEEAHEMDMDYIEALEYGMPPAGGLGIGIDRLAMVLSDHKSIREVILFPHLRKQ